MNSPEWMEGLRPWLRAEQQPAIGAAWKWLEPRCRTEEERRLAPALLLLLSPLNALVTPCRPAAGSCVNFQVTLSREGVAGPERVRLAVRAESGVQACGLAGVRAGDPEGLNARSPDPLNMWLNAGAIAEDPLGSAAQVLAALLESAAEILRRKPTSGART